MAKKKIKSEETVTRSDLLNNCYVVKEVNFAWCIDFTEIDNAKVFSIIDLGTREIKAHCTKPKHFQLPRGDVLKQVITTIELAATKEGYPVIVHHDLEKIFQSSIFSDYFNSLGIHQSFASHTHERFRNQAIERYHRTFRQQVKKVLIKKFNLTGNKAKQALNQIKKFSLEEQHAIFEEAVVIYNNSGHKHLGGETPNEMNLALNLAPSKSDQAKSTTIDPEIVTEPIDPSTLELTDFIENVIAKNGTLEAEKIIQYKKELVENKNELLIAFTRASLQKLTSIQEVQQITLNEISTSKDEIITSLKSVISDQNTQIADQTKKIEDLSAISLRQSATLDELKAVADAQIEAQRQAEETRTKRRNQVRSPVRSAATFPELTKALDYVTNSSTYRTEHMRATHRVCLIILYITGMRVSNLLLLTRGNLDQLLVGKEIRLPMIKSKGKGLIIWPLVQVTKAIVKEHRADIELLSKEKEMDDLILPSQKDPKVPKDRSLLTRELNKILKKVGKDSGGKTLTTHSFRIGVITALIESAGVHKAKDIVGHANIGTTYIYNRNKLTPEEEKHIIQAAEDVKQEKLPRFQKARKPRKKVQTEELDSSSTT